ncbi:MAG TPA: acyltransferase [Tepidisphaeraceae bacterium]|nr:acyltransferase [Tepidisphaeraceae bacterium]
MDQNSPAPGALAIDPATDPLLAPAKSFPETPLVAEERPPLVDRASLLDVNPATRHMENLDALRILAMFVIIVTHVTQPFVDDHADARPYGALYNSVFSVNVALRFGVPCFLMISFFIYWHQLYDKGRSWGELLARRLSRLVPAFLVWSLIYFALHKLLAAVPAYNPITGVTESLNSIDKGPLQDRLNYKDWRVWREILLFGRAHEHLYFLPMIIWSLLLIPVLRVLWKRPAVAWTFIGGMLVAWTVIAYGSSFAMHPKVNHAAYLGGIVSKNFIALPMLIFPLLGFMCAGQIQWRKFITHTPTALWVGLLIFGVALHVVETIAMLNYGAPATVAAGPLDESRWQQALSGLKIGRFLTAVPVFVLFLRSPLMRNPFPRVSKHAFGLHFMHPIIIIALTLIEAKLLGHAPLGFWHAVGAWQPLLITGLLILNVALTFFITFGLCLLVARVKFLEFLVV